MTEQNASTVTETAPDAAVAPAAATPKPKRVPKFLIRQRPDGTEIDRTPLGKGRPKKEWFAVGNDFAVVVPDVATVAPTVEAIEPTGSN